MNVNPRLSRAIAAILGAAAGTLQAATPADTGDAATPATGSTVGAATTDTLQEITVTAQRRTENIQDVPISIRALTSETLTQLNVATFDDYIRYLPNITAANNGPGQNEVFFRGLSVGSQASQSGSSTGLNPNVAIYLDNQSGQLPNRNLDIYAADLNRIEVLEGPQGTLFGAGAEAGVIRYITNEPKLDVTEGNVTAGYGVTAHGDPNTNVTAVLNVPLVPDTLAARAVIYDDSRGGYIDNVPATFTRSDTDIGIHYANYPAVNGRCPDGGANNGYCVPPGSPTLNNNNLARNAINPVTYEGIRVEALYKFNEDWNLLITQSYQDMQSQGVFYQQPNASDGAPLQPLEVTLFNPAYNDDRFENTAWTVNGKLAELKAVYTGGYLERNADQVGDYTNYVRGIYGNYYQCYGPGSGGDANLKSTCFSPSAFWHTRTHNSHQQHEFRLSTPDDWRLRAIAGAFYEDNKLYGSTAWAYKTIPPCTSDGPPGAPGNSGCLSNIGTFPGTTVMTPGIQPSDVAYYEDTLRETKQTAFFASADFDLIPKVLTVTLGTRHFLFENSYVGNVTSSFGCFEAGALPTPTGCHDPAYSYNLNAANLADSETGFRSRGNLSWHITPDVMVYYTFSQGFRPGSFNQTGGAQHIYGPDGVLQYEIPRGYVSDSLTNNEIGWKTEFFDHRLQWNGAIYRENWDNVQISFFDPGLLGNIFYSTNGQNFVINGIETSLVARVTSGLTLQYSASWNQSRQTNSPQLFDNNPLSVNYGKPITQICDDTGHNCSPVVNPFGPIGSPSADSPPAQFSVRARYEWTVSEYVPFIQFSATHTDHSFTQSGSNPSFSSAASVSTAQLRFEIPSYSTFEASCGVSKDPWYVTVYAENLANSNASTFISSDQFIVAETPLRPRVIGASFGYKF